MAAGDPLDAHAGRRARASARDARSARVVEAATMVALSKAAARGSQQLDEALLREAEGQRASAAAASSAKSGDGAGSVREAGRGTHWAARGSGAEGARSSASAPHGAHAGRMAAGGANNEARMLSEMFKVRMHACGLLQHGSCGRVMQWCMSELERSSVTFVSAIQPENQPSFNLVDSTRGATGSPTCSVTPISPHPLFRMVGLGMCGTSAVHVRHDRQGSIRVKLSGLKEWRMTRVARRMRAAWAVRKLQVLRGMVALNDELGKGGDSLTATTVQSSHGAQRISLALRRSWSTPSTHAAGGSVSGAVLSALSVAVAMCGALCGASCCAGAKAACMVLCPCRVKTGGVPRSARCVAGRNKDRWLHRESHHVTGARRICHAAVRRTGAQECGCRHDIQTAEVWAATRYDRAAQPVVDAAHASTAVSREAD
eukprot:366166-Chlamydomonas_euryale.AAC.3